MRLIMSNNKNNLLCISLLHHHNFQKVMPRLQKMLGTRQAQDKLLQHPECSMLAMSNKSKNPAPPKPAAPHNEMSRYCQCTGKAQQAHRAAQPPILKKMKHCQCTRNSVSNTEAKFLLE